MAAVVSEKTPEMRAWEAITPAMVARRTSGRVAHSGARRKNGFVWVSGWERTRAPWPR
jgi:hypothetical protein